MYDDRYPDDWEPGDVDRDEAIERAFALGVAAERGEDHPGEYERLVGVVGRALVQMAYDDGRSRAKDLRRELRRSSESRDEDVSFPDRDAAIWSRLVEYADDDGAAVEHNTRALKRLDVPDALRGFDLANYTRDDLSRLDLPEFLRR